MLTELTQGFGVRRAAQPLLSIGDAALEAGAPDLAAQAFDKAAQSGGRIAAEAALGTGAAALAQNRPEKALSASDEAARYTIMSGTEDIHFSADWLRAEALSRLGDDDAVRSAYELAFEGLRRLPRKNASRRATGFIGQAIRPAPVPARIYRFPLPKRTRRPMPCSKRVSWLKI